MPDRLERAELEIERDFERGLISESQMRDEIWELRSAAIQKDIYEPEEWE